MAGAQCCQNPPTLDPNYGAGHVEKLAGLDTYFTGSPDSKLAVLLIPEVFGYESPKLRKLADKVGAAGYYVVVPDFFYGDAYTPTNPDRPILVWVKDHPTDRGVEDAKRLIEALKEKGVTALAAAGLCWGAKVVVGLAKCELIKVGVLLHPSFVTVDDIKEVKAPLAILGAEFDEVSPKELLKQFEEVLSSRQELDGYVKIFPNVEHGWTVRFDDGDPEACKRAEEAHNDMLEWFTKYLK